MTDDPQTTRLNPNALLLVIVGLLFGFIGGYVGRPLLEAKPTDAAELSDALAFQSGAPHAAFPYTFENRRQAVTWLSQQISFLDRNTRPDTPSRPLVDEMKRQLTMIEGSPTVMLPEPLFVKVNDEVQRLQQGLVGLGNTPQSTPAPVSFPRAQRRMDD
jgi:hypothetical protein